jgi:hypothetical protein
VLDHRNGLFFGDESREGTRGRNEIHVRTIVITSSEKISPHNVLNFLFGQDIHTDLPGPQLPLTGLTSSTNHPSPPPRMGPQHLSVYQTIQMVDSE